MQNYQPKNRTIKLNLMATVWHAITFTMLIILYISANSLIGVFKWKFFPKWIKIRLSPLLMTFYAKATKLLDYQRNKTISRIDLIELSVRNMKAKKTRTVVTIGGMVIGIGSIVFLVSIGYGLQQLVVTRVARLDEMRQADVTTQSGGKIKINDESLADFDDIQAIDMALPLIAVVGRVNYQNSQSDMAVYGVTSDYLKQSVIKPIEGEIFDSNELTAGLPEETGQVAGYSTEDRVGSMGETIQDLEFMIDASSWVRVREKPTTTAKVLGYTKRVEGSATGEEVWGDSYQSDDGVGKSGNAEDGELLGKWIKTSVLLWKEEKCDPQSQGDCEDGKYVVLRDEDNSQVQKTGYFAEINVKISGVNVNESNVLGETTQDLTLSSDELNDTVSWVEIASEAGVLATPETKTVELSAEAKKQAVVNRAMLSVLGIKENEAVGKKFTASFVVVGDLLSDPTQKIESAAAEYTIIGVTPEAKTPVFYVPFIDLRTLGITNYSQVKVVVKEQTDLAKVRKQVEAMGYMTRSVADTVEQINSLFSTARTILMLLGMVALSVAALGMFNTLTVSLLERTREVGLMKAMGMKSSEVQELFLTESMIMGFFGGMLGIILGFILGKLAGIILSLFSVFKGIGFIDISYLPIPFVFVIILLSLLVGIVTGIYPARRATKISALNALRYE
jgi:ABC-type antimicrobial peptide transport system permease subunit